MSLRSFFWWLPFGAAPEITATELNERMAADRAPFILDVRTPAEWRASRIPGATNVPITSIPAELKNLDIAKDQPIVAICLSAHRSIPAVRALRKAGFTEVHQLESGMRAWCKAGLETHKGR